MYIRCVYILLNLRYNICAQLCIYILTVCRWFVTKIIYPLLKSKFPDLEIRIEDDEDLKTHLYIKFDGVKVDPELGTMLDFDKCIFIFNLYFKCITDIYINFLIQGIIFFHNFVYICLFITICICLYSIAN